MGAGASTGSGTDGSSSVEIDERMAFATMEREYLKRGKHIDAEGIAELKAIWLRLLAGETVEDDSTLVERIGPEQFKEFKQGVIDAVLRMQAKRQYEPRCP